MPAPVTLYHKRDVYVVAAGFMKRALSLVIDLFLLNIIVLFPFRPAISSIVPSENLGEVMNYLNQNPGALSALSALVLMIGVVALLYFAWFQSRFGQTLGMMATKLFVAEQDSLPKVAAGKAGISLAKALLRNLFIIPVFPVYLLWFIEPAVMVFDRKNQRLLEKLTKTFTVEVVRL